MKGKWCFEQNIPVWFCHAPRYLKNTTKLAKLQVLLDPYSLSLYLRIPFHLVFPWQLYSQKEVYNSIFSSVNKNISKSIRLTCTPEGKKERQIQCFRVLSSTQDHHTLRNKMSGANLGGLALFKQTALVLM